MSILKGFRVAVVYTDNSSETYTFKSQNGAKAFINGLDLTEVFRVSTRPVWSEPGETVKLEVHRD